ncbi:MAG: poly-beta-1,6 N-acetyl-D-glucosamine export porin PgaA [Rhodospirillaceae bacterium]|nr:poly-beta-1,6 N-acetyl-D-glucosamine export porin PgaA [Rhodospirillales bacterium]
MSNFKRAGVVTLAIVSAMPAAAKDRAQWEDLAAQAQALEQAGERAQAVLLYDRLRTIAPLRSDLDKARLRAISLLGYDGALELARQGHPRPAVELLGALYRKKANEPKLVADYVTVLGWAGEDAEILKVVATLPKPLPDGAILEATARANRNLRRYQTAVELYSSGAKRFPANPVYRIGEIRTLLDLARTEDAFAAATAAEQAFPNNTEVLMALAATQEARQQPDAAMAVAVAAWAKRYGEAVAMFEQLDASVAPDYVLREAASAYGALKRRDQAARLYRLMLSRNPKDGAAALGWARSLMDAGKLKEAQAVTRDNAALFGANTGALMALADIQERNRDFTGARATYQRVLAAAPKHNDARKGLRRVTPLVPDYVNALNEARQGRTDNALALLKSLHAADPGDTTVAADTVAVLHWAGRHDEAVQVFNTMDPARTPVYAVENAAHAQRGLGHHSEAAALYRRALARNPRSIPRNLALAGSLLKAGSLTDAEKTLVGLQKHAPQNVDVAALNGQLHEAKHDLPKAAAAYRRAAELAGADTALVQAMTAHAERVDYAMLVNNAADKPEEALVRMAELHAQQPNDDRITADYAALLVRAGQNAEAIALADGRMPEDMPDGVLDAVSKAYRNLGDHNTAARLYRLGWQRTASANGFGVGLVLSLLDGGDTEAAEAVLKEIGHQDETEVILARAQLHEARSEYVAALALYDQVLATAPQRRDVQRRRVFVVAELGAPQQALRMGEQEGSLTEEDRRRLERGAAAMQVRWADVPRSPGENPHTDTDHAIADLDGQISRWTPLGEKAEGDVLRARFDRMVALRNRTRMDAVLSEYDSLVAAGATPPPYALAAAADAYFHKGRYEQARDLYLNAVEREPKAFEPRLSLLYTYVALRDWSNALPLADQLWESEGKWVWLKGLDHPLPNYDHLTAKVAAAEIHLYAADVDEAEQRAQAIAAEAPQHTSLRHLMGMIAEARNRPRRAMAEYQTALGLEKVNYDVSPNAPGAALVTIPGRERFLETSMTRASLILRDYPAAEAGTSDLLRRFPEQKSIQRLAREWAAHDSAELRVEADAGRGHGGDVRGKTYGLDTLLFSPPIAYNWRLFGGYGVTHGKYDEGKGTWQRPSAGVEFRNPDWEAVAEIAGNIYSDRERGGGRVALTYTFDDEVAVGGSAEVFSRATPPRAVRNGVTANSADAQVQWRPTDTTDLTFRGEVLDFSDSNTRTVLGAKAVQGLMTSPGLKLDLEVNLTGSHNERTAELYYSPRRDALGSGSIIAEMPLIQNDDMTLSHRLIGTLGNYWQQDFGNSLVGGLRYEQTLKLGEHMDLTYGAGVDWLTFDGDGERDTSLNLKLIWKF